MSSARLVDLNRQRDRLKRLLYSGVQRSDHGELGSVQLQSRDDMVATLTALDAEIAAETGVVTGPRRIKRIFCIPDKGI